MHKTIKYLAVWLMLASVQTSYATLTGGSVSSAMGDNVIAHNQTTSVPLRWSLVRDFVRLDPGLTVSSARGEFYNPANGVVLGVVSKPLSKTQPLGAAPETIVVTENLTVPLDVVRRAYRDGIRRIAYRRDFTDCPGMACAALTTPLSITFSLGGSLAGPLHITRLSLRFEDNSVVRSLELGALARAHVTVTLNRPGLVRGAWELASPTSGGAAPEFQTIRIVNEYVASSGISRLESPPLRTDTYGVYQVRFRPIDPAIDGEAPVIRYFVLQQQTRAIEVDLQVLAPVPGAALSASTLFQWVPVRGAVAYKLTLVDTQDSVITGVMVSAETQQTRLPDNALARLGESGNFRWRIEAIGDSGTVVGASRWQPTSMASRD